ncbi:STAS domain-containing protein [Maridesulfovibrio hydrothermalis]|uniref:STAS domain-containing protein n=1 Tax=Maridesulfovibrio hydrothermalis AM13 = DSM 14728 TaxID=1121451 RepID=L0RE34_9BACT|nr:STAS domain-containing protein [Maridesulfovibrio hydrothermalis]CCO24462.1 conserved protein of unknown function [Maridesulfovibrio hydrothermalis AM13 = DSM 14728]
MDSLNDYSQIRLIFGVPFFSMDFNELMQAIGDLAAAKSKNMFFAASTPWLLDMARNPLLCPVDADYILAADSTLIAMADKLSVKIKMPLEYFEFPEQVARICAHYGYSLLHVSDSALKTDILIRDGYVPLSWDLFTHFNISGSLDEIEARSIVASANDSKPDIVLISAPPESLHKFVPEIYKKLHDCLLICIPQDTDLNNITEKINNVFSPLLLTREESIFRDHLKQTSSIALPSTISCDETSDPVVIKISGTLNTDILPELIRVGTKKLDQGCNIALDLADTNAVSLKGIETLYFLIQEARQAGKRISMHDISDEISNIFHQAGIAAYIDNFPGIIYEEPTE